MRTTIRLEDVLLRRAKARAAAAGQSLNDFIADAVRAALAARSGRSASAEIDLPVSSAGGGLRPGVDIACSAALLELMEEPEGAR